MVGKLGILFSGGKDSTYAAYLAKKEGYEISCLISIFSENGDSWMFHTPNIDKVREQAKVMNIPLIVVKTKGKKEVELRDLKKAIKKGIANFGISGIVTGAVESVYQSSRIQKICNELKIGCFNPLWQKNQIELLNDLIKNKFDVIIGGVSAYPLDDGWIGRRIDDKFIREIIVLNNKYSINPAGEGGEFESFVVNCPLFKKKLNFEIGEVSGEGNSWRSRIDIK